MSPPSELRAPRELRSRLTPFGRRLLLLCASLQLLALPLIPAGAPMLALPPALGLALLALAPLLARRQLAGLGAAVAEPARALAAEPFALQLLLERRARGCGRDLVLGSAASPTARLRPGGYVPRLSGGERTRARCAWVLPRRGAREQLALEVASSFPLALAEARARFELPCDLLALPRLGTLRALDARLRPAPGGRSARRRVRAGDEEFRGLREWREGESLRRVHWKATARRGVRVVRELEGEDRPPVAVVLWRGVAALPPAGEPHARFEQAVSVAATALQQLAARGHALRLVVVGERDARVLPVRGRDGLARALELLARVEPLASARGPGRALSAAPRGSSRILVHAGDGARAAHQAELVLAAGAPELETLYTPARRSAAAAALALA